MSREREINVNIHYTSMGEMKIDLEKAIKKIDRLEKEVQQLKEELEVTKLERDQAEGFCKSMRDDIAKLHELERKYRWRDVNKELPEDQRCIVYDKTISLTLEVAALNGVFYGFW
jgi:uncharacterized protein (UPF0335 family)